MNGLPVFAESRGSSALIAIKAKYVLGLTATPIRRDGQQPIIFMQCGPTRHTAINPANAPHDLEVVPHSLLKRIDLAQDAGIQDVFRHIVNDLDRTAAIGTEIASAFNQGRKVLVLSMLVSGYCSILHPPITLSEEIQRRPKLEVKTTSKASSLSFAIQSSTIKSRANGANKWGHLIP